MYSLIAITRYTDKSVTIAETPDLEFLERIANQFESGLHIKQFIITDLNRNIIYSRELKEKDETNAIRVMGQEKRNKTL